MTVPRIRLIARAPAVQALLIQAIAFAVVVGVALAFHYQGRSPLTLGAAALLQGVLSAALTRYRGLAGWWMPIQLLFPVGLLASLGAGFPPQLFLAAFLVMLVLYWTTFRTQVPYFPSNPAVWNAVLQLLPAGRPLRVVDIGSGFGGLLLFLAERRPDCEFVGVELAPLPWLTSAMRARLGSSSARFIRADYETLDFGEFDVVFAYLSPAAMPALWDKSRAEMRSGTMLLSYEFPISGEKSHIITRPVGDGPTLFGWRF